MQDANKRIAFLEACERQRIEETKASADSALRFSPKSVRTHRTRIGFSAGEYGKLLGVSAQTVYQWERGKSRPRKPQLAALAKLRTIGKKEARERLRLLLQKEGDTSKRRDQTRGSATEAHNMRSSTSQLPCWTLAVPLNILRIALVIAAFICLRARTVTAFEIVVDYTYDTQGFFADPIRRTAIEAVAGRFSRVITSELLAVEPVLDLGRPTNWRIGFDHPGNGGLYQLSTATDRNSDAIYDLSGDEAEEYGFPGLEADQWILFAGGRTSVAPA